MSTPCFIEVENDIIELKQYPDIEKISELGKRIIKNGVDHGYDLPEIEISYGGAAYEKNILKVNRSKSVDVFELFDHYLKKKYLFLFTRPTKNCLIMESHLKKKNDIARYSLKKRKKKKKIIL